jgi:hypothetical protein
VTLLLNSPTTTTDREAMHTDPEAMITDPKPSHPETEIVDVEVDEQVYPVMQHTNELREMIFEHALVVQPDGSRPPLLIALDAAFDQGIYYSALRVYHRINYNISKENVANFKDLPRPRVLGLKHIKIVFPLRLSTYKLQIKNNLQTIILDNSNSNLVYARPTTHHSPQHVLAHIIPASADVTTIILKLEAKKLGERPDRDEKHISDGLGLKGRRTKVEGGFYIWTWESTTPMAWNGMNRRRLIGLKQAFARFAPTPSEKASSR